MLSAVSVVVPALGAGLSAPMGGPGPSAIGGVLKEKELPIVNDSFDSNPEVLREKGIVDEVWKSSC